VFSLVPIVVFSIAVFFIPFSLRVQTIANHNLLKSSSASSSFHPVYHPIYDLNKVQHNTNHTNRAVQWGHAVPQWERHCTTNRKVAESIPGGAVLIFH
jgi:hypothetical protein